MSLASLRRDVQAARSEMAEKAAVVRALASAGHRKMPRVFPQKVGRYTVRCYVWEDTPWGSIALVAGPSVDGAVYGVERVTGDVDADDVDFYLDIPGRRDEAFVSWKASVKTQRGQSRQRSRSERRTAFRGPTHRASRTVRVSKPPARRNPWTWDAGDDDASDEGGWDVDSSADGGWDIDTSADAPLSEHDAGCPSAARAPVFGWLYDANGRKYRVLHRVVATKDDGRGPVLASNLRDFAESPGYPEVFQARGLGRVQEQTKIEKIAKQLDPNRLLLPHADPTFGSPVVWEGNGTHDTRRGTYYVLGGNSRTVALLRASDAEYRKYAEAAERLWPDVWPDEPAPAGFRYILVRQVYPDDCPTLSAARALNKVCQLPFGRAQALAGATQRSMAGAEDPLGEAVSLVRGLGVSRGQLTQALQGFDWRTLIDRQNVADFAAANANVVRSLKGLMGAERFGTAVAVPENAVKVYNSVLVSYLPKSIVAKGFGTDREERAVLGALPMMVTLLTGEREGAVPPGWGLLGALEDAKAFASVMRSKSYPQIASAVENAFRQQALAFRSRDGEKIAALLKRISPLGLLLGLLFRRAEGLRDPLVAVEQVLVPYVEAAFNASKTYSTGNERQGGMFGATHAKPKLTPGVPVEVLGNLLVESLPMRARPAWESIVDILKTQADDRPVETREAPAPAPSPSSVRSTYKQSMLAQMAHQQGRPEEAPARVKPPVVKMSWAKLPGQEAVWEGSAVATYPDGSEWMMGLGSLPDVRRKALSYGLSLSDVVWEGFAPPFQDVYGTGSWEDFIEVASGKAEPAASKSAASGYLFSAPRNLADEAKQHTLDLDRFYEAVDAADVPDWARKKAKGMVIDPQRISKRITLGHLAAADLDEEFQRLKDARAWLAQQEERAKETRRKRDESKQRAQDVQTSVLKFMAMELDDEWDVPESSWRPVKELVERYAEKDGKSIDELRSEVLASLRLSLPWLRAALRGHGAYLWNLSPEYQKPWWQLATQYGRVLGLETSGKWRSFHKDDADRLWQALQNGGAARIDPAVVESTIANLDEEARVAEAGGVKWHKPETAYFKYGLRSRKPGPSTVPRGYVRFEETMTEWPTETKYGVVVYDRELTKKEVERFGLHPVVSVEDFVQAASGPDRLSSMMKNSVRKWPAERALRSLKSKVRTWQEDLGGGPYTRVIVEGAAPDELALRMMNLIKAETPEEEAAAESAPVAPKSADEALAEELLKQAGLAGGDASAVSPSDLSAEERKVYNQLKRAGFDSNDAAESARTVVSTITPDLVYAQVPGVGHGEVTWSGIADKLWARPLTDWPRDAGLRLVVDERIRQLTTGDKRIAQVFENRHGGPYWQRAETPADIFARMTVQNLQANLRRSKWTPAEKDMIRAELAKRTAEKHAAQDREEAQEHSALRRRFDVVGNEGVLHLYHNTTNASEKADALQYIRLVARDLVPGLRLQEALNVFAYNVHGQLTDAVIADLYREGRADKAKAPARIQRLLRGDDDVEGVFIYKASPRDDDATIMVKAVEALHRLPGGGIATRVWKPFRVQKADGDVSRDALGMFVMHRGKPTPRVRMPVNLTRNQKGWSEIRWSPSKRAWVTQSQLIGDASSPGAGGSLAGYVWDDDAPRGRGPGEERKAPPSAQTNYLSFVPRAAAAQRWGVQVISGGAPVSRVDVDLDRALAQARRLGIQTDVVWWSGLLNHPDAEWLTLAEARERLLPGPAPSPTKRKLTKAERVAALLRKNPRRNSRMRRNGLKLGSSSKVALQTILARQYGLGSDDIAGVLALVNEAAALLDPASMTTADLATEVLQQLAAIVDVYMKDDDADEVVETVEEVVEAAPSNVVAFPGASTAPEPEEDEEDEIWDGDVVGSASAPFSGHVVYYASMQKIRAWSEITGGPLVLVSPVLRSGDLEDYAKRAAGGLLVIDEPGRMAVSLMSTFLMDVPDNLLVVVEGRKSDVDKLAVRTRLRLPTAPLRDAPKMDKPAVGATPTGVWAPYGDGTDKATWEGLFRGLYDRKVPRGDDKPQVEMDIQDKSGTRREKGVWEVVRRSSAKRGTVRRVFLRAVTPGLLTHDVTLELVDNRGQVSLHAKDGSLYLRLHSLRPVPGTSYVEGRQYGMYAKSRGYKGTPYHDPALRHLWEAGKAGNDFVRGWSNGYSHGIGTFAGASRTPEASAAAAAPPAPPLFTEQDVQDFLVGSPNKLNSMQEYLHPRVEWKPVKGVITETVDVSGPRWEEIATNLLSDMPEVAGKGGNGSISDPYPNDDSKGWVDLTEAEKAQYRRGVYSKLVEIRSHDRPSIYVDPSGHRYARYVLLPGTLDDYKAVRRAYLEALGEDANAAERRDVVTRVLQGSGTPTQADLEAAAAQLTPPGRKAAPDMSAAIVMEAKPERLRELLAVLPPIQGMMKGHHMPTAVENLAQLVHAVFALYHPRTLWFRREYIKRADGTAKNVGRGVEVVTKRQPKFHKGQQGAVPADLKGKVVGSGRAMPTAAKRAVGSQNAVEVKVYPSSWLHQKMHHAHEMQKPEEFQQGLRVVDRQLGHSRYPGSEIGRFVHPLRPLPYVVVGGVPAVALDNPYYWDDDTTYGLWERAANKRDWVKERSYQGAYLKSALLPEMRKRLETGGRPLIVVPADVDPNDPGATGGGGGGGGGKAKRTITPKRSKAPTAPRLQGAFTEDSVRARFEEHRDDYREEFKKHAGALKKRITDYFGPTRGDISKAYNNGSTHGTARELRNLVHYPSAGRRQQRSDVFELDPKQVEKEADRYASQMVDAMALKVLDKVGDLQDATLTILGGGQFMVKGTMGPHTVRVDQTRVLKVSKLGKLFHQWPARIYVDGQFTPAEDYKALVAKLKGGDDAEPERSAEPSVRPFDEKRIEIGLMRLLEDGWRHCKTLSREQLVEHHGPGTGEIDEMERRGWVGAPAEAHTEGKLQPVGRGSLRAQVALTAEGLTFAKALHAKDFAANEGVIDLGEAPPTSLTDNPRLALQHAVLYEYSNQPKWPSGCRYPFAGGHPSHAQRRPWKEALGFLRALYGFETGGHWPEDRPRSFHDTTVSGFVKAFPPAVQPHIQAQLGLSSASEPSPKKAAPAAYDGHSAKGWIAPERPTSAAGRLLLVKGFDTPDDITLARIEDLLSDDEAQAVRDMKVVIEYLEDLDDRSLVADGMVEAAESLLDDLVAEEVKSRPAAERKVSHDDVGDALRSGRTPWSTLDAWPQPKRGTYGGSVSWPRGRKLLRAAFPRPRDINPDSFERFLKRHTPSDGRLAANALREQERKKVFAPGVGKVAEAKQEAHIEQTNALKPDRDALQKGRGAWKWAHAADDGAFLFSSDYALGRIRSDARDILKGYPGAPVKIRTSYTESKTLPGWFNATAKILRNDGKLVSEATWVTPGQGVMARAMFVPQNTRVTYTDTNGKEETGNVSRHLGELRWPQTPDEDARQNWYIRGGANRALYGGEYVKVASDPKDGALAMAIQMAATDARACMTDFDTTLCAPEMAAAGEAAWPPKPRRRSGIYQESEWKSATRQIRDLPEVKALKLTPAESQKHYQMWGRVSEEFRSMADEARVPATLVEYRTSKGDEYGNMEIAQRPTQWNENPDPHKLQTLVGRMAHVRKHRAAAQALTGVERPEEAIAVWQRFQGQYPLGLSSDLLEEWFRSRRIRLPDSRGVDYSKRISAYDLGMGYKTWDEAKALVRKQATILAESRADESKAKLPETARKLIEVIDTATPGFFTHAPTRTKHLKKHGLTSTSFGFSQGKSRYLPEARVHFYVEGLPELRFFLPSAIDEADAIKLFRKAAEMIAGWPADKDVVDEQLRLLQEGMKDGKAVFVKPQTMTYKDVIEEILESEADWERRGFRSREEAHEQYVRRRQLNFERPPSGVVTDGMRYMAHQLSDLNKRGLPKIQFPDVVASLWDWSKGNPQGTTDPDGPWIQEWMKAILTERLAKIMFQGRKHADQIKGQRDDAIERARAADIAEEREKGVARFVKLGGNAESVMEVEVEEIANQLDDYRDAMDDEDIEDVTTLAAHFIAGRGIRLPTTQREADIVLRKLDKLIAAMNDRQDDDRYSASERTVARHALGSFQTAKRSLREMLHHRGLGGGVDAGEWPSASTPLDEEGRAVLARHVSAFQNLSSRGVARALKKEPRAAQAVGSYLQNLARRGLVGAALYRKLRDAMPSPKTPAKTRRTASTGRAAAQPVTPGAGKPAAAPAAVDPAAILAAFQQAAQSALAKLD